MQTCKPSVFVSRLLSLSASISQFGLGRTSCLVHIAELGCWEVHKLAADQSFRRKPRTSESTMS